MKLTCHSPPSQSGGDHDPSQATGGGGRWTTTAARNVRVGAGRGSRGPIKSMMPQETHGTKARRGGHTRKHAR